ncbi:PHD-finger domain-containing protein, partial [Apiospora phragmitis]
FGNPNAQPPSPKQTPPTVIFPSSVFETPKTCQPSFEVSSSSNWTPLLAEDYSVFNATPGNLRGAQAPFIDFSVTTPYHQVAGHKRPLSADDLAVEIASHPILTAGRPRQETSVFPRAPAIGHGRIDNEQSSDTQEPSYKKVRLGGALQETQLQTATPPPSRRKGGRRLAPKLQTDKMQNDQGYGYDFVAGTPHHNNMPNFATTPTDMFGYPLSAPATAPLYTDSRLFWEADPSMSAMDLDFSASGADMFQTSLHRPMNSPMNSDDWGRANEMFQDAGIAPPQTQTQDQTQDQTQTQNQTNGQLQKKERALAPKPAAQSQNTNDQDANMLGTSFTGTADDPFSIAGHNGGVDPGLLFSGPPPSSIEPATFDPMSQMPLLQPPMPPQPLQSPTALQPQAHIRRSASTKEASAGKRAIRPAGKSGARPGLLRSFSENRGKKPASKTAALPALAPAIRPVPQAEAGPESRSSRPNGRTSPLKNHHRLSSLCPILKFTIDSRGRARAETTVIVDGDDNEEEDMTPRAKRKQHNPARIGSNSWASSEDSDSSTDDEPIIIPSRNTSFALPDPKKPSTVHPFHSSQRSVSERSTSSLGIYNNEPALPQNDGESEAETVLNEPEGRQGDAASELRKVLETRQKRASMKKGQRVSSSVSHSASSSFSRASLSEVSLPMPSSSRGRTVRCLCKSTESLPNSDGFMVQCESCDLWLHGKCINISRRTMPSVYICGFCANTPNARGVARARETGNRGTGGPGRVALTSPLAHKSLRSFR